MSYLAIIPARGGSKRIPNKNIKKFCGMPMIAWTIKAALSSNLFDRTIVSTDSDDIAEIARQCGADVPFIRPGHLSDDFAGTHEVITHAITHLLNEENDFSAVCCMYATAPFVQIDDLRKALNILNSGKWNYVFPACQFPSPIFRSFKQSEEEGVEMFFPDLYTKRSQDLPCALYDAGQFYWAHTDTWLNNKVMFNSKSYALEIPKWRVQDIDNLDDWKNAELLHQVLRNTN